MVCSTAVDAAVLHFPCRSLFVFMLFDYTRTCRSAPAKTGDRRLPVPCFQALGRVCGAHAANKLQSFFPETAFSEKILLAERASSL